MPLQATLKQHIQAHGPITVAEFMAQCLYNAEHGYYTTQNPFADFTTAPELTPLFGEMLGLWVADYWEKLGSPARLSLVEAGGGQGTLMADALRAIHKVRPACFEALEVFMVETSPKLTKRQQAALAGATTKVSWHTELFQASIPKEIPVVFIANELLDAFPVHQYLRTANGYVERMVGLNNGTLCWQHGASTALDLADDETNELIERSTAESWLGQFKGWLDAHKAAGLFIDYGYTTGAGDSLQAVKNHEFVDILTTAGTADLTTHVNFKRCAHKLAPYSHPVIDLAHFLTTLGLPTRAVQVHQKLSEQKDIDALTHAMERLLSPNQMGGLHKVLAFTTENMPTPAAILPRDEHAAGGE